MCLNGINIAPKAVWIILIVGLASAEPTLEKSKMGTDLYNDSLPAQALARIGTVRLRHGDNVNRVAFTPEGKTVVSCGWDGVLRSWDTASGRERKCFRGHQDAVMSLSICADGRTLASISQGITIRIWNLATGKELHKLNPWRGGYWDVCFSPDGESLVSCGGNISIWETKKYRAIKVIELGIQKWIYCIAFSPGGKIMASGDGSGAIRFWDTSNWKELGHVQAHPEGVRHITFSPDGKYLASAGFRDGILILREAATGKEIRRLYNGPPRASSGIAFSPDSKTLAWAWGSDYTIRLFEAATGKEIRQFKGHRGVIEDVAFSPDGKILASAGGDSTVRLWDVSSGKQRLPSGTPPVPIHSIALSPDGSILATQGWQSKIQCWDASTGKLLREFAGPHKETWWVNQLSFSPDGGTLYALASDAVVSGWEIVTARETRRFALAARHRLLALSPDGKTVITAPRQNAEPDRLYDLPSGKEIGRCDRAFNAAFVPGGRFLVLDRLGRGGAGGAGGAGGGANGQNGGNGGNAQTGGLALWDLKEGKILRNFSHERPGHGWASLSNSAKLIVSPDGEMLLAGTNDHGVYRWDMATGEPLPSLDGRQRDIESLALSADGHTLASGGRDGTIHLWEITTGQPRGLLRGHRGPVLALDFSRDGRRLASGSKDTTALIWDLTDGLAAASPKDITPKQLDELRNDLAGEDAVKAYRSIWRLTGAAKQTVPFLQARLRPVPAVEDKHISRLITDLDSDEFAVRNKARGELQKLGEIASKALHETAAKPPSLEVRRQVDSLLAKLKTEKRKPSPERIRLSRAVEVLERIGTAEARDVLRKLAGGAAGAQLTREAKASLQRLAKHAKRPR